MIRPKTFVFGSAICPVVVWGTCSLIVCKNDSKRELKFSVLTLKNITWEWEF